MENEHDIRQTQDHKFDLNIRTGGLTITGTVALDLDETITLLELLYEHSHVLYRLTEDQESTPEA